ncbi:MAG: uroporphyrinogen decarboxylase (URO-D) [Oscillospiraceae bacterium]|jgi:hypothetical protein|nr:uroporphyrinogen decarboxylase (URO-D) [Oscillospiraceae bacterium]
MLSVKENLFETLKKGGNPDRLVNMWEPFELMPDPLLNYTLGNRKEGENTRDRFGTLIVWPEGQISGMPHVTDTDKVLPDVTRWREYVKIPDLAADCSEGWEPFVEMKKEINSRGLLSLVLAATGVFEQLHFLMGFEDTLMNFLLEPEAMHELTQAIGEYRYTYMKLLADKLKPDVILSHDDWGSKHSLFVNPETWREFIKPQYAGTYKMLRDSGIIVMHHADSYLEHITEDMIDIHIDIWQGALPENDLLKMQKLIDGRMVMMGGCDMSKIDMPNSREEDIRAETRRAIETYTPGGNFIVSATYGGPGDIIYPHVGPIMSDEISKYNREKFRA